MEVSHTRDVQGPFGALFCIMYLMDIHYLLCMPAFYAWGIRPFGVEKMRKREPEGGEPVPSQQGNGA